MWNHPHPIFLDFETQSAANIRETGGRQYAYHPSTRPLMCGFALPGLSTGQSETAHYSYHLWIPDYIQADTSTWTSRNLWPFEIKPGNHVNLHRGELPPDYLFDAIKLGSPLVAHNAYMFDRYIWDRFIGFPAKWLDTLLLAKASGRPGKLDTLGKSVLGQGKDRAAKLLPELCGNVKAVTGNPFTGNCRDDGVTVTPRYAYPYLKSGELQAFARYCVGDVHILRKLWDEFSYLEVEADVIETHDRINQRGIEVDIKLLTALEQLSTYSVNTAKDEIAGICGPELNIRSTPQMHEWLEGYGIQITDDNGKPCLRKEIVQRFLDSPYLIEEHLHTSKEIPPEVLDVLRLRMKALRITSAKVERALERVDRRTNRIYDTKTYHTAHTGRASSAGVQLDNLPRPLKGVDIRTVIEIVHDWNGADVSTLFDAIKLTLPDKSGLTVDDVCSTLIRPSFVAKVGHVFAICDYSQVESRCLAWLADERKLLEKFHNNEDVYKWFGAKLYGCEPQEIVDIQRQASKVVVLGMGYGMGPDKFRVYAANQGIDLVSAGITAEQASAAFRDTFTNICGFRPDKNKSFRTNGLWHKLDKAVMECVGSGVSTQAGKCIFSMRHGDLVCELPSGRKIYYPSAKIEDMVPGYCYTLGLPPIPKATVTYISARGKKSLYGGIITENCLDASTNVLTHVGYIPITHVNPSHKLWDGVSWVQSSGCVFRGYREVMQWQGISGTADHLIHDGNSWKKLIHVDERFYMRSLRMAANSVNSQSYKELEGRIPNPYVNVSAEMFARLKLVASCGKPWNDAKNVGMVLDNLEHGSRQNSRNLIEANGGTYIPAWFPDVPIQSTEHTRTMAEGVLRFIHCGLKTGHYSFSMLLRWLTGITRTWKSTEWKQTETMNRVISECVPVVKMPGTDVRAVFDILQSGSHNRFTILTNRGPVLVHNCDQAISRDLLYEALVEMDTCSSLSTVLHVHDEGVNEVPESGSQYSLNQMIQIMSKVPEWASGFPVACEGFTSPRFLKKPWSGYYAGGTHDTIKRVR